ncbi:hypothetical protein KB559_20595 [Paenibacillus sp. Marseille-P2973]|uniref:hypothetical protein n=1 Tax=Paenibacillus sp. Marseille-P2973 TaxID=1871032 RepID=UPI001B36A152|nr:hypothetical protein [Paenibacillus sp. Marseille-P2973]MBQ4901246.1 hypothetical protein [Paenibacillus sp. Marseille-P2973]
MVEEQVLLQKKLDQLLESVSMFNNRVNSTLSYNNERLISIERLMWKIERKLIDQDKMLDMLGQNELIQGLVNRKYHHDRIQPFHLQSKEYQEESISALQEDDDEDE